MPQIAKLFFKKKITERVKLFGSDVAKLHEMVPAAILPPEFGGTLIEAADAAGACSPQKYFKIRFSCSSGIVCPIGVAEREVQAS